MAQNEVFFSVSYIAPLLRNPEKNGLPLYQTIPRGMIVFLALWAIT